MEIIVRARGSALAGDVSSHSLGQPEQHERLVDEVRAQVVEQARSRRLGLAPALLDLGTEAIEMRLVVRDLAQASVLDETAHGEEVVVPATVLEHRQAPVDALGQRDQRLGLGGVQRERLVDHHMLAGLQRGARQGSMALVGRGDHHQLNGRIRNQILRIFVRQGLGKVAQNLVFAPAADGRQAEAAGRGDQRGVEERAGRAVADETGGDRVHGGSMSRR